MTKQEFGKFAMAMKTYYPRESSLLPNNQTMELWFRQLNDLDYITAERALNNWVKVNKWSPTIAEIRAAVEEEKQQQKLARLFENDFLLLEVEQDG